MCERAGRNPGISDNCDNKQKQMQPGFNTSKLEFPSLIAIFGKYTPQLVLAADTPSTVSHTLSPHIGAGGKVRLIYYPKLGIIRNGFTALF